MLTIKQDISTAIIDHLIFRYGHNLTYANELLLAVRLMLSSEGYALPDKIEVNRSVLKDDFQNRLSKINEKEARRKEEGVYYTNHDVTDFIACNTMLHYVCSSEKHVYSTQKALSIISKSPTTTIHKLLNASVFDPTVGAGEFMLSAITVKLRLMDHVTDFTPLHLVNTLFGNDIEDLSTDITKLRIFFHIVDAYDRVEQLSDIVNVLNRNFSNQDAVIYDGHSFGTKDIVLGNPPYVEYHKFSGAPNFNYGNVYADVLHNSVDILSTNGIMAFVVPLSYVSTARMARLRNHILSLTNKQIVLNFADRPDSLFSCVHQKLTLVFAQKNADYFGVLSSSYKYWYQQERVHLFDNISLIPTVTSVQTYLPKVGNKIEKDIYRKFSSMKGKGVLDMADTKVNGYLYINQRGCFWMKVFPRDMHSNSYAKYPIPPEYIPFCYCLLNSSLFFLLWIIISDGWHITNKELSFIKLPRTINDPDVWVDLMQRLDAELEKTKVYVGTKQVDYEYKHKLCKSIIDEIDNQLAVVYKLSSKQCDYIKNFALKYRTGDGTKN